MSWEVIIYESASGRQHIEEFLSKLPVRDLAGILREIDLLARYGVQLPMPHSKRIDRNLYELRIRGANQYRIFYCCNAGSIYLLHIIHKKTQKIPLKDIEIAKRRKQRLTDL